MPGGGRAAAPAGTRLSLFIKNITDKEKNPLESFPSRPHAAATNIPPEVARSQGHHGHKGAIHGIKGGRPRLDLTDEERAERRRKQQQTYRRRNGIPAKKAGPPRAHPKSGFQEYYEIWGKPPGEPLTSEEFAKREPLWNAEVLKQQEAAKCWELGKQQRKLERQHRREARGRQHLAPPPAPAAATPSVGRNQPCPCGSNRKFKKCCGP